LLEGGPELVDGLVEEGVEDIGGDLSEGFQDEAALVHARVGNCEIRFVKDLIAIKEQVEIDDARSVFEVAVAAAAEVAFDAEELGEELAGGERGFELDGAVDELAGARGCVDGVGFEEVRDGRDRGVGEGSEALEGGAEGGLTSPLVGAQGYKCADHEKRIGGLKCGRKRVRVCLFFPSWLDSRRFLAICKEGRHDAAIPAT
jgi:hypothetical protein